MPTCYPVQYLDVARMWDIPVPILNFDPLYLILCLRIDFKLYLSVSFILSNIIHEIMGLITYFFFFV